MSPSVILLFLICYFAVLMLVAKVTSGKSDNEGYFTGNHLSPWIAVAFGMIGDSLSGVTFISVPGAVANTSFHYLQLVLGYFCGYFFIAGLLLPMYYRMNLVSIYSFLGDRSGRAAQMTGSVFFLISRILGAAGRLYLAASVIQLFVFDAWGIPFWLSVSVIISLMLLYTYKGGIKTLVWTDTLQSSFLLLGVVLSVVVISGEMNLSLSQLAVTVVNSNYSEVWDWDISSRTYFWKQFLGGMFITIAMTGLDQNMMQKNLSCKSLKEAKKNMISFSFVMVMVNILFLSLGALLYEYAAHKGISLPLNAEGKILTDEVFPGLALRHLGSMAALVFILGLTAATFNSADSVLTTLTTSFYYDILQEDQSTQRSEKSKTRLRMTIHLGFAVLLLLVIIVFRLMNSRAIIDTILTIATYTYGPLIGLFAYSIWVGKKLKPWIAAGAAITGPLISRYIDLHSSQWWGGYKMGYELLLMNGLLVFGLLYLLTKISGLKQVNVL
jgi:Na+/proline symporter